MAVIQSYNAHTPSDILELVSRSELPALRDMFLLDWPHNAQAYNFLDAVITWLRKNPRADIRVTCPDGDWRSDGTFIAIIKEKAYDIYIFTLDQSCTRLTEALQQTRLIEWDKGPYFLCIHEDQDEAVMATLRKVGGEIGATIEMSCWWLPRGAALDFEVSCPPEMYIAALSPSYASVINSKWAHSFPGSEQYVSTLLKTFGGYGVFTKSTHELCSWVMLNYGTVAILQTLPQHKRKGYAAMLIKTLSKRIAKEGCDSVAHIVNTNVASQELFKSIGFRRNNSVRYVQFKSLVQPNSQLHSHL